MRALAFFLLGLVATLAGPALAQDLPGRVGRLAWTEGGVALYQDPDRGWDEAYVNSPVTSENSVWTDPGARAELQVGAMALRMDETSQLDVSRLDDATFDATLERGTVAVRIRHFLAGDVVRLSTPQASFLLQAQGRYRLDADPDRGESRLSVFEGAASLEGANGRIRVAAGRSVVVWGEDRPAYALQEAYPTDFDRWAMARDERWTERRAPEYVSYEMTGYEDLDAYGRWEQEPVYGAVWFPTRVEADWAPYRYGRWTYVRPWGWTWVDAEPWGYAPFHYGRWVHIRDRWAWSPGRRVDRPVWAPALVGFIGGGGWSARADDGPTVGWYPLAPSEPYRPWYNASRNYTSRVNVAVVNVPQQVAREHREWNRDQGSTVVRRDTLVAQRPVAQARVQVTPEAIRRAPAVGAPASVLPNQNEVREAHRREAAQSGHRPSGPPAASASAPARGAPGGAPPRARNGTAASPAQNAIARPAFAKPSVTPRPAAQGAAPPPPASPIARKPPNGQEQRAHEAQQQQQERAGREAQQQQQRAAEQQQRAAQQAQQQQQRAAQEQQRAAQQAQQQQRAAQEQRAAQQAQEQRQRAAQEQQRAAQQAQQQQQRAAQEQRAAQQAQEQRQRAAQEQQRAAQQAQQQQRAAQEQRAAQQAQEQRQRAAQEQQRAAQQAQQQQQRAAQEQQRAAQQAQEQRQRAAQEQQRAAQQAQQQQQRAAQEQQRAAQQAQQQQQKAAEQQQRAAQQAQQQQQKAAEQQQRAAREAHPQQRAGQEKEKEKDKEKQGHGEGG